MYQNRLFEYLKNGNDLDVLIVEDDKEALKVSEVFKFFNKKFLIFPDFRANYLEDLRSFKSEITELFIALRNYDKGICVISPLNTILRPLPRKSFLEKNIKLNFADKINLKDLKETLYYWGFEFVDLVQDKGELSFRSDVLDIFIPNNDKPHRINFFDDEIESIRNFDFNNQRTYKEELESVDIYPAFLALKKDEFEELFDKCSRSDVNCFIKDVNSLGLWYLDDMSINFIENKKSLFYKNLKDDLENIYSLNDNLIAKPFLALDLLPEAKIYKNIEILDLKSMIDFHQDKKISLIVKDDFILKRHFDNLENINIIYNDAFLNLISKDEVIISLNESTKKKSKRRKGIVLDDLKKGDYVVHEEYGIGIFDCIKKVEILGVKKEVVNVLYSGDDRLLLPVDNLSLIDKYITNSSILPTLDKLGKSSFSKLKEKVKKKLLDIASNIIDLAAKRKLIDAPVLEIEDSLQKKFEQSSGFTYTLDQDKVISDLREDLKSSMPMDRLLSADVGFGKTEIAMNAILMSFNSAYQSLVVVPTTLLSNQHYKTFLSRLSPFGLKIARLDRFVSKKEKEDIINSLKSGKIDLLVGTHSVLSLSFKNLALCIIDEEHKFGVKQKEKLKKFNENLHVLSMSATPIPRSLNMALSSVKSISYLNTPPLERKNLRTFLKEYDEKLIKEVILRELRRTGQVFYVFNSIVNIEDKKKQILDILPNLKILVLHSKISSNVIEKEMIKFENNEYNLLISTSIIESGIHIPNVNTIIVDGANAFGMADLHQLRGRVGRASKEGYAYFLVDDIDAISDDAKKRLLALENNSFLGSGNILARHDLEIRGGGNILGEEQSGQIKHIGYSLYIKMLENTINELNGKLDFNKEKNVELRLSVEAYISEEVVSEDNLRLELYRRLSKLESIEEIYNVEDEIKDRFSKIDTPTSRFIDLCVIKRLAFAKKIKSISNYNDNISFLFFDSQKKHIKAKSDDEDDILKAILLYLRAKQ